tara:strand:+ start:4817 stop:5239 length:423 start_codon:yes stop_codon:yes gene_type:complete
MATETSLQADFKRYNGSTYDAVLNAVSISGPSLSMSTIDSTNLNSTDSFKEYVAGWRDGGDVSISCHLDPQAADGSKQLLIRTDFEAGTATAYRIVLASGAYIGFTGLVTSWTTDIPEEDIVSLEITLKVTGKPTYADSE